MKHQQNQHFSHHHVLNTFKLVEGETNNCDACEQIITTEPFHGCIKCKYYLHDNCFNTPRALEHPSHPSHPLTLLPTSTFSSRSYNCDACGSSGNGFVLCCARCNFDIHLHCANLPASVLTNKHHHELKLFFGNPTSHENIRFSCDICSGTMNLEQWLYYCVGCDFASHLDCVKGKARSKEMPKKGKGKSRKPEAENRAAASSEAEQPRGRYIPSADDINAINEAEDEMCAAALRLRIGEEARQAALDLWDSGRSSSDDDYY